MSAKGSSATGWVQLTRALVARELVDGFGLPEREAAERLGLAPSAVSQYLTGKRLGPALQRYGRDETARRLVRRLAQRLATEALAQETLGLILAAAGELAQTTPEGGGSAGSTPSPTGSHREGDHRRWVAARIQGEQVAVAECMRLAQRSHDELTRALFRQIASDSLRHAEIVASLGAYLDRGVSNTVASGITRADVDRLISREHAAEASEGPGLGSMVGGVMEILFQSMEADERKHEALLDRLRSLLPPSDRRSGRRRPRRAAGAGERGPEGIQGVSELRTRSSRSR